MNEEKLLNSAIDNIKDHNWDEGLIDAVCKANNISRDIFMVMFPKGNISLAERFFARVDSEMMKIITEGFYTFPIHIQVSKLLEARLQYMLCYKEVVKKILWMKNNLSFKVSHIFYTTDTIWNSVEHKSTGFDYYTRRMMLACVYKNCLLHIKLAKSDDLLEFMQKQLEMIGKITKIKNKIFN